MSTLLVLNHHSLPFSDRESANSGFLLFLKLMNACRKFGLNFLLVDEDQDVSLMRVELSEGYFVSDWHRIAKVEPELVDWARIFRSIETRQPLFQKIDIEEMDGAIEAGLVGSRNGCRVISAAYWFDAYLVSFATSPFWRENFISSWILDLRLGNDNKQEKSHQTPNLSSLDSVACFSNELIRIRNEQISSARDIWKNRSTFFPNLCLLDNQIGTALKTWSHRMAVLNRARDALLVLNDFSGRWRKEEFLDYQHDSLRDLGLNAKVSGESLSVRNDKKKRTERLFWLDDGRQVYCENHIKLPDGFRLHFYPDSIKKIIYVAYLGPHLTL